MALLKFLLIILFLIPPTAGHCLEVRSAHSVSQGGSSRSLIDPVDSLYMNPAALAHFRDRYISTFFRDGENAVSLYDSANNNPLSGALGYFEKTPSGDKNLKSKYQIFSFALAAASPRFDSGKLLNQWTMGVSFHQNRKIKDPETETLNTFDLGFLFTPHSYLGVGLVFYNLSQNNSNEGPDFSDLLALNQLGLGVNFIYTNHLRFRADWLSSENFSSNKSTLSLGFETFYSDWFAIGLGVNQNLTTSLIHYAPGFGFKGPRFTMNYA